MQFQFNFGPGFDPVAMHEQQIAAMKQMIDEKRCIMCQNTYLINDQITICQFSNECVDSMNGQECEHWEPAPI